MKYYRRYVDVSCRTCSVAFQKRKDSLREWNGECRSCAMKKAANTPHAIEARRKNGRDVMARVGKLPHYSHTVRRGPANNKWRGGITPENQRIRLSSEMKKWRAAVMERDDYTCQMCDKRGGDMHADHIKPFALFPELRFDTDNGRTLCVACHRKYGALVCNGKITRQAVLSLAA